MFRHFAAHYRAAISLAICTAATLWLSGCGTNKGSTGGDTVHGKVTMDGEPVAGQVVFVGADRTETKAVIGPDGSYSITNLPKGDMQVLIKGTGLVHPPVPKGAAETPPPPAASGVAAPAKYGYPSNGLKLTVTGGDQPYDIVLTK